jgi:hypothetical protein
MMATQKERKAFSFEGVLNKLWGVDKHMGLVFPW